MNTYNDITDNQQRHETKQNDTLHNDTQHNGRVLLCRVSFMRNVNYAENCK
jgi:hypothetical protein